MGTNGDGVSVRVEKVGPAVVLLQRLAVGGERIVLVMVRDDQPQTACLVEGRREVKRRGLDHMEGEPVGGARLAVVELVGEVEVPVLRWCGRCSAGRSEAEC